MPSLPSLPGVLASRAFGQLRGGLGALTDAFAWPLTASHYLELVNPLWTTHTLQARVQHVWDETAGARSLILKPGRRWRVHRAGQHIGVRVAIGGVQYTRIYSISSAPERADGCITITVKSIPDGQLSPYLVRDVVPGEHLTIGFPQGDFVLPEAVDGKLLFITAGSGITPIMSMLRSLVLQNRALQVTHIHYAPYAEDVIFRDELLHLARGHAGYVLHMIHTREPPGSGRQRAFVADDRPPSPLDAGVRHFSAEALARLCPDWSSREAYACGPAELLDAVEAHWAATRLEAQLHVEHFRARLAVLPEAVMPGDVRFAKRSVVARSDGVTSLLRLAEQAGLTLEHGCRMGICHSCSATLISGCVRDLRNNVLHRHAGQKIQLCVSAAAGDVEIDV
jgi:ferredoxin-NADP reductase